jgi:hypothetical protein
LKKYINHFTVLVNGSPQVVPLTLDLHEHLVNVERVSISVVLSSQSSRKLRAELIAPQSNSFVANLNTPLRRQVFDIAVTQIETMLKPHDILNDFGRAWVALV